MKMVVLGAGRMGVAAAYDFARQPDVTSVVVADQDGARADAAARQLGSKVKAVRCDLRDLAAVRPLLRGAKAALSAASYTLNVALAGLAIEEKCHFVDLGGNNDVVRATLALDAKARSAGVALVPDCGLAPGMAVLLAARLARQLDRCDRLKIRVGGLPQDRPGPLEYRLVFSVEGLINEYKEPCLVVRGGRTGTVEALTEIEPLEFPAPFGKLECFHTSGGLSTLPETFAGAIPEMDYKTIRYPGHCERMKLLFDLGFFAEEPLPGASTTRRKASEAILETALGTEGKDSVLVRVEVSGTKGGRAAKLVEQIVDLFDESTGFTAMARTTAFPAAVVALECARGRASRPGAQPGERCIDLDRFHAEVVARGIAIDSRSG